MGAPAFESADQVVEYLGRKIVVDLPDSFAVEVGRARFSPGRQNASNFDVKIWRAGKKRTSWSEAKMRSHVRLSFDSGSMWERFENKKVEAFGLAWDGCEGFGQFEGSPAEVAREIARYARSLAKRR